MKKLQSRLVEFSGCLTVVKTVLSSRHQAENVKATTEAVKKALFNCRTAQTSAEKAIGTAKADILDTEARLAQVSCSQRKAGYSREGGRSSSHHRRPWSLDTSAGKRQFLTLAFLCPQVNTKRNFVLFVDVGVGLPWAAEFEHALHANVDSNFYSSDY